MLYHAVVKGASGKRQDHACYGAEPGGSGKTAPALELELCFWGRLLVLNLMLFLCNCKTFFLEPGGSGITVPGCLAFVPRWIGAPPWFVFYFLVFKKAQKGEGAARGPCTRVAD